jgi:hypothetical protein
LYFVSRGYKSLYNKCCKRGYKVSIDWNNAREIWKFSLNREFDEVIHDDTAEDIIRNIHKKDEKNIELNVIEDIANIPHQNEKKYLWTIEKSKI